MKTAGIIAEYNPFHNGHQFHIEETRRQTGADYVIAVMSGDFVQRGAPAAADKFLRAQMALENGADLVIELPLIAAVSSAEGFAEGGVCLLDGLGVVDFLSFGCEASESEFGTLEETALLLANETEEYKEALSCALKKGCSYPNAVQDALLKTTGTKNRKLLSSPNNILALQYLKAIIRSNASLKPVMIRRRRNDYHDTCLHGSFSSASAIREQLLNPDTPDLSLIRSAVPESVFALLSDTSETGGFLSADHFTDVLYYALLEKTGRHSLYEPENRDLFGRARRHLEYYRNWAQFAALLKTRNQTMTSVNRFLTHLLLNIQKEDFLAAGSVSFAPYARILGFRKSAAPLIDAVQSRSRIPVITRLSAADHALEPVRSRLLDLNIHASALYQHILSSRSGRAPVLEYRRPLLYL